ncbi:MipA/OmpV family protein [Shewanella bicestrii]|uniref:MipA/OmpV family protein n=1 Tax=Shewanella sp. GD03713 TaxID=2975372 RepID=UPI00244D46E1|nr:MipA/OmpV family protein [Shewanella sp. GD03713]MDH1471572.1 MipA/OmpV family protein [Shewanella sp. GD03713]
MTVKVKKRFLLLALLSQSAALQAKEIETVSAGDWQISLAAGYGALENPRAKVDNVNTWILPTWYYYGENFYVENFTLGYSLYESDNFIVDLQTRFNEDGFFYEFDGLNKLLLSDIVGYTPVKQPINPKVVKFEEIERNLSYLGGVNTTWVTPYLDVSLGYFHDITGVHQGNEIQLRLKRSQAFSWGALGLEVGAIRKSENLVSYYYKLTKEEQGPLRSKYQPSATINYHARTVVNVPIFDNVNFVGILEYTWLGQEITDSVLIDKSGYLSGFVGFSYDF